MKDLFVSPVELAGTEARSQTGEKSDLSSSAGFLDGVGSILRPDWGADAKKLFGTWRLLETKNDGHVRPERGARPLGLITYHESGWMSAQIQPDRPPIRMVGAEPTAQEAVAALLGYTAYFGSFSVDETMKIITHRRLGSVTPGWEQKRDYLRAYTFEGPDRVMLRPLGNRNSLLWERLV